LKIHPKTRHGGTCCIEVEHTNPPVISIIALTDLYDAEPLDVIKVGGKSLVFLKWHVIGLDV